MPVQARVMLGALFGGARNVSRTKLGDTTFVRELIRTWVGGSQLPKMADVSTGFFLTDTATTHNRLILPAYRLSVTALSVVITWLFPHRSGCLLPVIVMHASANNAKILFHGRRENAFALSESPIAWTTTTLLWITYMFPALNVADPWGRTLRAPTKVSLTRSTY